MPQTVKHMVHRSMTKLVQIVEKIVWGNLEWHVMVNHRTKFRFRTKIEAEEFVLIYYKIES
jgi:hypothetical protein